MEKLFKQNFTKKGFLQAIQAPESSSSQSRENEDGFVTLGDKYQFKESQILGFGRYSTVFKGRIKNSPLENVAIKKCDVEFPVSKATFVNELFILQELKELQHENIVTLFDNVNACGYSYMILEYCNWGDFEKYLKVSGFFLDENNIRFLIRQIVKGMKVLYSKRIVHGDLKPPNILISYEGDKELPRLNEVTLKIADFGMARRFSEEYALGGTNIYMSPEVALGINDHKCDLWSIGVIIYRCLTAKKYDPIIHFSNMLFLLFRTDEKLSHLLTKLLLPSEDRINFEEFFNHPFHAESAEYGGLNTSYESGRPPNAESGTNDEEETT